MAHISHRIDHLVLRFLSFGKYLNLTIALFGQLVDQILQRNSNSKEQFVLTNFVETPVIPNFEEVVKRLVTSIRNVTTALEFLQNISSLDNGFDSKVLLTCVLKSLIA